jgi:hypothetical protein
LSLNKKQNVEVVLAAGGSPEQQPTDPKLYKQNLKNRITTLKSQQKDTQGTIKALERELNKLSSKSKKVAAPKKELKVVNKGKNNKTGKK